MHGLIADTRSRRVGIKLTRLGRRKRGLTSESSVDTQGRFIGIRDIERGLKFFWNAQHRRGAAPMLRDFRDVIATPSNGGRECSLNAEELLAIHELRHEGKGPIARRLGLSASTVAYHLKNGGSKALRLAIANNLPSD